MAARPPSSKSFPTLVTELWELVKTYAKQETIDPLKGVARFVAFGAAGSVLLGVGSVLLTVAGLRALQTETGDTFDGSWSWAPYGITFVGAMVVVALALSGMRKRKGSR